MNDFGRRPRFEYLEIDRPIGPKRSSGLLGAIEGVLSLAGMIGGVCYLVQVIAGFVMAHL